MSRILLPQRGIVHDRLQEDWIVPLILRNDAAAARAVIARIGQVVASATAMAVVAKSATAMDAVVASAAAMDAVAASATAMAAVFGTSGSPNYMAREKVWNSEIASEKVLNAGRAWLVANVQIEASQSVAATIWWQYSGKKALVLQGYYAAAVGVRFRYTRAGGESADYAPGSGTWFDVNIATYTSGIRNNRSSSQTIGARYVPMEA